MEDLKYRNSTTRIPRIPIKCTQNSSVLLLQRVATAATTAVMFLFIAPVEAQHVSTTSSRNKKQVFLRRPPSLTPSMIGDGRVITGTSMGRTAIAITTAAIREKLFGHYPSGITSSVSQLNMAVTARQRTEIRAKRKEKEKDCNLPHYAPFGHLLQRRCQLKQWLRQEGHRLRLKLNIT